MFDNREELQKFKVINLQALEESIPDLSDDVRNSIVLFNKAIESIGKGSEDIAIIELKKAVAINPGFHEAINLLGLCYAYTGEKEKAARMFERVIELERNGIQAYVYRRDLGGEIPEYLQLIVSGQDISLEKVRKAPAKKEPGIKPVKRETNKRNIARYGTGFLLGALLMFIAAYPYVFKEKNEEAPVQRENEIIALEEDNAMLQRELNNLRSKYDELEGVNNSIEDILKDANRQMEYFTGLRKIFEVCLLDEESKYEEAADSLLEIDGDALESIEKTWFELLKQRIMPVAAMSLYDEGKTLCQDAMDYEKGLEKLSKVFLYQDDFKSMEALLYYTGKCHQGVGEYDEAMKFYNRILEEYPSGYYSQFVPYRIAEIGQATGGSR